MVILRCGGIREVASVGTIRAYSSGLVVSILVLAGRAIGTRCGGRNEGFSGQAKQTVGHRIMVIFGRGCVGENTARWAVRTRSI